MCVASAAYRLTQSPALWPPATRNLYDNSLSGTLPDSWSNLSNLISIWLSDNPKLSGE